MTARGHARPRLAERLADLFRGHHRLPDPPGRAPAPRIKAVWNVDARQASGQLEEIAEAIGNAGEASGRHHQPAGRPPWDRLDSNPGSLGAYWARILAAADLSDQQRQLAREHRDWYGWGDTMTDVPVQAARPYSPEPEPVPVPVPEPVPVPYPPLSLRADYLELPQFRAVIRGACRVGLRGIGIRQAGTAPALPDFQIPGR